MLRCETQLGTVKGIQWQILYFYSYLCLNSQWRQTDRGLSWESGRKRPNQINQFTEKGFPSFAHGIDGFPNGWNPLCAVNPWLISGVVGLLWCEEQRLPIGLHGSGLMMHEIKRLKRGQQRKTILSSRGKSTGSPNMPLCKSPFENCLTVYVCRGWWTIRWKWTSRKVSKD